MKIVTVNIPESYLDAIEKLTGDSGLYPSRSELIRVAVREFLKKELKMARNMAKYNKTEFDDVFDEENLVRVPIERKKKLHVYKCPVCFQSKEADEEGTYFCQRCFEANGSKIAMKHSRSKADPNGEPVREFKTFRIIQRLD